MACTENILPGPTKTRRGNWIQDGLHTPEPGQFCKASAAVISCSCDHLSRGEAGRNDEF